MKLSLSSFSFKGYWCGWLFFALLSASGTAAAAGDAAAGASKAGLCVACHGPAGISFNPIWPNLAGQQVGYLEKQMKAFRDGARQEPTMAPFVASLSDEDIADLAAHFSGLSCK